VSPKVVVHQAASAQRPASRCGLPFDALGVSIACVVGMFIPADVQS
jgi:hypothetical protein